MEKDLKKLIRVATVAIAFFGIALLIVGTLSSYGCGGLVDVDPELNIPAPVVTTVPPPEVLVKVVPIPPTYGECPATPELTCVERVVTKCTCRFVRRHCTGGKNRGNGRVFCSVKKAGCSCVPETVEVCSGPES